MLRRGIIAILLIPLMLFPIYLTYAAVTVPSDFFYEGTLKGVYVYRDYSSHMREREAGSYHYYVYIEIDREDRLVYIEIFNEYEEEVWSEVLPISYMRESSRSIIIRVKYIHEEITSGSPPVILSFGNNGLIVKRPPSASYDYYKYILTIILYGPDYDHARIIFSLKHIHIYLNTHSKYMEIFRGVFRGIGYEAIPE